MIKRDTFQTIVHKLINLENNAFDYNYNNTDKVGKIYKMFFYPITDINNTKHKLQFFYETLNNFYFSKDLIYRVEFENYFVKIQKIYHILNNLVLKYKRRKAKLIVNTDLQLEPIQLGSPNVICIYHDKSKYLFKINELLRIIYTCLTNSYLLFSEPITIKNPYNNLPFSKSILYYINDYLMQNTKISAINPTHLDLFFKFRETNFNLTEFVDNYESHLRDISIKNYIIHSTQDDLYSDIMKMIYDFNLKKKIKHIIDIHPQFPKKDLINIMKPYLHLYYKSHYSLVENYKIFAKSLLNKKLCEFQRFNPNFGKKYITFSYKKNNNLFVKTKTSQFNYEHCSFNNNKNFLHNHLQYKFSGDDSEDDDDNNPVVQNNVQTNNTNTQINYRQPLQYMGVNNNIVLDISDAEESVS